MSKECGATHPSGVVCQKPDWHPAATLVASVWLDRRDLYGGPK